MTTKPKRLVFWLEWVRDLKAWVLIQQRVGERLGMSWATKEEAMRAARAEMRRVRALPERPLVQLRIRTKDGRVASEATYGRDPRRSKG